MHTFKRELKRNVKSNFVLGTVLSSSIWRMIVFKLMRSKLRTVEYLKVYIHLSLIAKNYFRRYFDSSS